MEGSGSNITAAVGSTVAIITPSVVVEIILIVVIVMEGYIADGCVIVEYTLSGGVRLMYLFI